MNRTPPAPDVVTPSASSGTVKRIYGNLGRLIGGKAGAGIISLLYMMIAIRALGPRDYGVLILVHTFAMTVGGIVEFPGWHAVVRYGAQAVEAGDQARLVRLLRFAGAVEAAGGACAVLVAAVLAPVIGPRLGWSQTALDFALPYSLAVLASIRATAAGYLQLCGRFDLLGVHVLVSPIVRLVGAAVIWLAGGGLHTFLVLWLAAALVEWASMWALGLYVARQTITAVRLRGSTRGVLAENGGIWRFMIGANADATFSDLAPRLTSLTVGWALGPLAAALYAVALRATAVISQPAQLLGQAAYAELASLVASGAGGAAVRHALVRATAIAMVLTIPALAVFGVASRQIAVLLGGTALAEAGSVMLLLAVGRALLLVGPPASATLVALGRPGRSVAVNIGTSLAFLPLLVFAVMRWDLIGVGWASIVQAAVAAVLLTLYVFRESGGSERILR